MAEKQKKKRHIGLWAAVLLFIIAGILFFVISRGVAREIPRVTEYDRSRLSSRITFASYERMPQISFPDHLAVCGEQNAEHAEGLGEIKPVLVNEHFFEVYNIHVGGSAVTKEHVAAKAPAAVISDQAAHRMSVDGSAVGQTFSLWGREFTVVGVYHKPSGFLRGISSDIYDRVYVPYTCFDNYGEVCVDSIAAPKGTYSEKALSLFGMTKSDKDDYIENDLTVKHDMIAVFPNWFVFVIALILSVAVIKILMRLLPAFFRRLRADAQSGYFWQVVRRNLRGILLHLLVTAALIAIPVVLFVKFPVRLIMPLNFIPADNIFDFGHYVEVFTGRIQVSNANLTAGNGYYSHLFSNAMLLLSVLFVVLTVLSVAIAVSVSRMVKQWRQQRRSLR